MGGKRIAEQVRRALILAAKTAPVVVAIDASGCGCTPCALMCDPKVENCDLAPNAGGGGFVETGGWASADSGPLIFQAGAGGRGGTMGMVDRDAGADARPTDVGDARADRGG